jgi:hypothetical protein
MVAVPYTLRRVTLSVARSHELSDGSIRRRYEFVAPLTEEGRIDLEGWNAHRGACFVRRFWDDEPEQWGLLVHRADGPGGSTWGFEVGTSIRLYEETSGHRFDDHVFRVGEQVSLRETDEELLTFRVVSVG